MIRFPNISVIIYISNNFAKFVVCYTICVLLFIVYLIFVSDSLTDDHSLSLIDINCLLQ